MLGVGSSEPDALFIMIFRFCFVGVSGTSISVSFPDAARLVDHGRGILAGLKDMVQIDVDATGHFQDCL
jgi:hypothetical protein